MNAVAILGALLLIFAVEITELLTGESGMIRRHTDPAGQDSPGPGSRVYADSTGSLSHIVLVSLVFVAFGFVDLAHDVQCTLAASLQNDAFGPKQIAVGNMMGSGMCLFGRVVGMFLCSVPIERLWGFRLLETHFRAVMAALICVLLLLSVQVASLRELYPGSRELASWGDTPRVDRRVQSDPPESAEDLDQDDEEQVQGTAAEEEEGEEDQLSMWEMFLLVLKSSFLRRLLVIHFGWWFLFMCQSFWWTSWVAVDLYRGDPMAHPSSQEGQLFQQGVNAGARSSLVACIAGFIGSGIMVLILETFRSSLLNDAGTVTLMYRGTNVVCSFLMLACWVVYRFCTSLEDPILAANVGIMVLASAMAVCYSLFNALSRELIELMTENVALYRGTYNSLLTLVMNLAQILSCLMLGILVEWTGHVTSVMVFGGAFSLIFLGIVCVWDVVLPLPDDEEESERSPLLPPRDLPSTTDP